VFWCDVKSAKETTQAFILRIWVEPREKANAEPKWRGVIEHVDTGERVYFNNLDQVSVLLSPYIEAMGVRANQINSES